MLKISIYSFFIYRIALYFLFTYNFFMDKSPDNIKKMFNDIASSYDFNNMVISFGLHKLVKKKVVKSIDFSGNVLDLCTGTGDIAGLISNNYKCNVIGLDFSIEMLKIAKNRYAHIDFIEGDCTNLPFANESFDFVTISFGLRNIENYDKALDEIYRVLKPNGKFIHLDFGKKNPIANVIYNFIVPKLVSIFYKNLVPYDYLVKSKKLFFDETQLISLFEKHLFNKVKTKSYLLGGISYQVMQK